ncbi:MAG TPA: sigma factor-like helix-turn-helix DNA-binding protein [Actinomycetota bacterium]|nr:sigma factor-like helix-turn-helix DNA-binding protein [Actinomycetota bacterium]
MAGSVTTAEVGRLTFEAFYASEFTRVFDAAYALSRDQSTALDATQEAFARAYVRWRRLERETWAGAWVTTTALNVARRALRKERRRLPGPAAATAPDPGSRLDVLDALRALPRRQREAAVLFYVADLPLTAVAAAMGLSEGAVKSHLSRAREHLRRSLEEIDV